MSDLDSFSKRVQEAIRDHEHPAARELLAAEMAEVSTRLSSFHAVGTKLISAVVRPRLTTLASRFKNAAVSKPQRAHQAALFLGYCDEFPANARVEFVAEHDRSINTFYLLYQAQIVPAATKFDRVDRLEAPLENVSMVAIENWVEDRLLSFLRAYLGVGRAVDDPLGIVTTDPVCEMQVNARDAAAVFEYRGTHTSSARRGARTPSWQIPFSSSQLLLNNGSSSDETLEIRLPDSLCDRSRGYRGGNRRY